jgi:predicted MFS family arabinose efflux permease
MEAKTGPGPSYRWAILGVAVLIVFGALGLSRFSYTSILPPMQDALRLDNAQAGGLATANLAGYMAMAVIGGALASRFGVRRVITGGLLLACLGMVITGLATNYGMALGGRILSGIGAAAANVPAHAMIGLWFSQRRRGIATGTVATGASMGLVVAGPLVPFIIRTYGENAWRLTWFILAGVVGFLAVVSYLVLRDRPGYRPADHGPAVVRSAGDWRKLYLSGKVWHLGAVYFMFGFAYMTYMTFFNKRLIADLGYTQGGAGNMFMILGWASLACGFIWGFLADWIGRKRAMVTILLIQAVAYAVFALWTSTTGIVASAVLFGLTAWGVPAIMAVVSADLFGPLLAPATYGFLTVFHGFGQAAGPYLAGKLADSTPTFTPSYLMAAGVAFLGGIGLLSLRWPVPGHASERPATPAAEAGAARVVPLE